ncbi:hypothetical protein [Sphingomonas jatrophae]|uniref:Uncharacterized protein n=1 Tax=Sphingomonas jatrophae TaxID=1166337 RepID=A0A1I6JL38_9SPHN|nr:hypothetical protein [Sphingomonas jatrophae]SFR79696.1 hypothetical protein SAMN05192580_0437 [Sphingomonas jatrophae]
MTKPLQPLTFENALARIASLIGWASCAQITGASERTVRSWSERDIPGRVRLDAALALDSAWIAAGGDGAPLLECYALRVEADSVAVRACTDALRRHAIDVIRANADAEAALVAATAPGATAADFIVAEREVEEAHSELAGVLPHLRAAAGHNGPTRGDSS